MAKDYSEKKFGSLLEGKKYQKAINRDFGYFPSIFTIRKIGQKDKVVVIKPKGLRRIR